MKCEKEEEEKSEPLAAPQYKTAANGSSLFVAPKTSELGLQQYSTGWFSDMSEYLISA